MTKPFLLLAFLAGFFSTTLRAQTGTLSVYAQVYGNDDDSTLTHLTIEITHGKDLIEKRNLAQDDQTEIKNLEPGSYHVFVYSTYTNTVAIHRDITVSNGKNTNLNLEIDMRLYTRNVSPENDSITEERIIDKMIVDIGAGYGNNFGTAGLNPCQHSVITDFNGGVKYSLTRFMGIGLMYGLHFSHHYFTNDSSLITLTNRTYERYTYLAIPYSLFFRFTTGNQFKSRGEGVKLDIGAKYYLPILFRHVTRYDWDKVLQTNIHQFKDFRLYAGLGAGHVMLFGEYRVMDFILGVYPEIPRFSLGLRIVWGDDF